MASDERGPIGLLREGTRFRCVVIAGIQIGGAVFARLAHYVYGEPLAHETSVRVLIDVALLMGIAFLFTAFVTLHSKSFRLLVGRINNNPLEIDDIVTATAAAMMIIDAVLCALLVQLSGGFKASIFAPLMLAILSTGVMLRLPRNSYVWAVGLAFFALVIAVSLQWTGLVTATTHGTGNLEAARWMSQASIFVLTAVAAVLWLRDPLPKKTIDEVFGQVGPFIEDFVGHRRALEDGMRDFLRDSGRRVSLCTLSKVHDLKVIIEQAVILNVAYVGKEVYETRRRVAYLTFLSHWIDDLFDHFYGDIDELLASDTVDDICRTSQSFAMLYRRMSKRLRLKGNPDKRKIVNDAIKKICLAAIMQRSTVEGAVKPVVGRYIDLVTAGATIEEGIKDIYESRRDVESGWLMVWGTAKVVSELFDCNSINFRPSASEIYSILGAPILILQNLATESEEEAMSPHFRKLICDPSDWKTCEQVISERLVECVDLFEKHKVIAHLEGEEQLRGRRAQLAALLTVYGACLPPVLRARYEALLNNNIVWTIGASDAQSSTADQSGEVANRIDPMLRAENNVGAGKEGVPDRA